ncbi:MAG: hypothetical protein IJ524_02265 [Bacteroidales bacterium]|nr:hypothetical protein [Bacteroidales bacterium]
MKKIVLLSVISLASCFLTGCGCRYFGLQDVRPSGSIFEYKPGAVLPEYYLTTKHDLRLRYGKPMLTKTYPLTAGYYFNTSSYDGYGDMVIMDFTLEDYYAGNIPEDWLDHWEEHVLVEKPFRAVWTLPLYECEENYGVPYYCKECTSTNTVDTVCINRLIETGEIWDYAYRIYLDTTAVEEER